MLWLPQRTGTLVQLNSMSQQRGTKHSYKLFSLLHNPSYILVWHPHNIYHMNHGYYGVFNKYTTLVLGHWKFATDKHLILRAQGLSVANFGLGSYTCRIYLLDMVYILHKQWYDYTSIIPFYTV